MHIPGSISKMCVRYLFMCEHVLSSFCDGIVGNDIWLGLDYMRELLHHFVVMICVLLMQCFGLHLDDSPLKMCFNILSVTRFDLHLACRCLVSVLVYRNYIIDGKFGQRDSVRVDWMYWKQFL